MSPAARFPNRLPRAAVKAIDTSKILGIRAGGDRADEGYAELARLLGQYNVQPREISIHQLGVMLRDDARAWGIITNAIEQAARRAIPAVTPPAPAVERVASPAASSAL